MLSLWPRPGARVGADVVHEFHAHAAQRAIGVGGQLGLGHVAVGVGGGLGIFGARGDPADWSAKPTGQRRDQDLLRIDLALGAEAAADVGRQDAHPVWRRGRAAWRCGRARQRPTASRSRRSAGRCRRRRRRRWRAAPCSRRSRAPGERSGDDDGVRSEGRGDVAEAGLVARPRHSSRSAREDRRPGRGGRSHVADAVERREVDARPPAAASTALAASSATTTAIGSPT